MTVGDRATGEREPEGGSRVCAVIVHHRGLRLLDRCLECLEGSIGVEVEVVVVANGCREALPERIASSAALHVVRSERSIGFSDANNLGAAWARENLSPVDAYFFVNNDALVEPGALAALVAEFDAAPECGIVGPQLEIWGAPGVLNSLGLNVTVDGEAWDEGIGRPSAEYELDADSLDVLAVTGAALMVRRELFEELGGWNEIYGFYFEDIDLCLRARSRDRSVRVARRARVAHAISATAARGSDFKRKLSWRNRFLLLLTHWPWGLLLGAGSRLAWTELKLALRRARARAWSDLELQARSWAGALVRAPRALATRRRSGGTSTWVERLKPRGSVPVIELPELPADAELL